MSKFYPPFVRFSLYSVPKGDGKIPHWLTPRDRGTWSRETFLAFFEARLDQHWYPVVSDGLSATLTFADLPPKLDDTEYRLAIGWTAEIAATAEHERFVAALGLLALLARIAPRTEEVAELSRAFVAIRDRVAPNAIDANVPYWFSRVAAYQIGTGIVPPGHAGELTAQSLNPATDTGFKVSDFAEDAPAEKAGRGSGISLKRFIPENKKHFSLALAELRRGFQHTGWVPFVFPQLSRSALGDKVDERGIRDVFEARAYLQHPTLGKRVRQIVRALLAIEGREALAIFACPDNLRVRASLTLFEKAAPEDPLFSLALDRFFNGRRDPLTLQLLASDVPKTATRGFGTLRQSGSK
jgi:uncharacterized protein (DUF1810 family)